MKSKFWVGVCYGVISLGICSILGEFGNVWLALGIFFLLMVFSVVIDFHLNKK